MAGGKVAERVDCPASRAAPFFQGIGARCRSSPGRGMCPAVLAVEWSFAEGCRQM